MLKLLKYDIRKNREVLLITIALTALLQVANYFSFRKIPEISYTLAFLLYFVAGILLFVYGCITYGNNLRSYSRRLLPISSAKTLLSSFTFSWILVLIMGIPAIIHIAFFTPPNVEAMLTQVGTVFTFQLLDIFWSVTFLLVLIKFVITCTMCLRTKGKGWIGLGIFIGLSIFMSASEFLLFGVTNKKASLFSNIQLDELGNKSSQALQVTTQSPDLAIVLFEIVIAALLIFVTLRLLDRKIEIQ